MSEPLTNSELNWIEGWIDAIDEGHEDPNAVDIMRKMVAALRDLDDEEESRYYGCQEDDMSERRSYGDLSTVDIEAIRAGEPTPREVQSLCNMALRTYDAEQRAEQLAKIEQEEVAAREQAEADAHEHRVNYDNLFDEAEKIRHQRDEARQEAALLRCVLRAMRDEAKTEGTVSWATMDAAREALQSAPPASDPSTEALGREAYPQAYSPAPADAPASEPPCPACSGEMDVDHTCPPLNLRATDPAPADHPQEQAQGGACKLVPAEPTLEWAERLLEIPAADGHAEATYMIEKVIETAPDVSEPEDGWADYWRAINNASDPAPADRPEPCEALEAFSRVRDFIADCEVGDTEPGTGKNEENREVDARLVDLDYMIRPYISQPAPAVPDWLRPTGNDQTLGWSWSVRGLQHIASLVTDAAGGEPEPSLEAVDAILTILHQERALAAQPSESPAVPTWIAKRVIAARDAIIEGDDSEAWHQLYGIADPTYTKRPNPWAELERIAAAPTPTDDGGQDE